MSLALFSKSNKLEKTAREIAHCQKLRNRSTSHMVKHPKWVSHLWTRGSLRLPFGHQGFPTKRIMILITDLQ